MILPSFSSKEEFNSEINKLFSALKITVPGRETRLDVHANIAVKDNYKGKSSLHFLSDNTKIFYLYNKKTNLSSIFKPKFTKFKMDTQCLVGNSLIYSLDIKISADMSVLSAQKTFVIVLKEILILQKKI